MLRLDEDGQFLSLLPTRKTFSGILDISVLSQIMSASVLSIISLYSFLSMLPSWVKNHLSPSFKSLNWRPLIPWKVAPVNPSLYGFSASPPTNRSENKCGMVLHCMSSDQHQCQYTLISQYTLRWQLGALRYEATRSVPLL